MALRKTPPGRIGLTLSDDARTMLWPRVEGFLAAHPEVPVGSGRDNGFRDLVEEGFDAGIRLGESFAADKIAMGVSPDWRLVLVAAPDHLARRGTACRPQDLIGQGCINHRHTGLGGLYAWDFAKGAETLRVRVTGPQTFISSLPMVTAEVAGLGIGCLPEELVEADIAAGRPVRFLEDWCPAFAGDHLHFLNRRANLTAFRARVEALRWKG